jgi:glutamine amidotransferase
MSAVIIKYNAVNVHSVDLALQRLDVKAMITDDPERIKNADKVIFPGVGEARSAMIYLRERNLDHIITELRQPFLGICLGLQLMCSYSEENDTTGLDIFNTAVRKFPARDKVPHMGWNSISRLQGALFKAIPEGSYVYFVHSYYAEVNDCETAHSHYILPFSAAMQAGNYYAVQFHPEKSGTVGEEILRNFLTL